MELEFKGNEIISSRELSMLDNQLHDFVGILTNHNIKYVVASGYIEQDRTIGDVEILVSSITFEKFLKFWLELEKTYECLNSDDPIDAYNGYLRNYHAIRIRKKTNPAPNFLLRFVKDDIDRALLKYRKALKIEDKILFISSPEIQIPYKLSMGSGKDIEDARLIFKKFKNVLNTSLFEKFLKELDIPEESVNQYLGTKIT